MPRPRKVLMLALDAATPALLRQWTGDGTLPNLARLAREGVSLDIEGPTGLEVGATWPTFYTGLPAGHHGVCWIDRVIPGTYRKQRMTGHDFAHLVPFWKSFSDAGRRSVILDVPFAPVPSQLRGVQVSEWGSHDGVTGLRTSPARLAGEVTRRWGEYPAPLACDTRRLDAAGYRDLANRMIRGTELRADMTTTFLADGTWDFGLQVFTEFHCGGHLLWHYHDGAHPGADPDDLRQNGDLLREIYVAADTAVGKILAVVPDDTIVVTGSIHGMEQSCGSSLLLPYMLEGLGAYRRASSRKSVGSSMPSGSSGGDEARHPGALSRWIRSRRVQLYEARQWVNTRWLKRGEPIDIVPSATRAFPMGFGADARTSGVRFNLRGREPGGILEPGAEADRFAGELVAGLATFTDADTGAPLVDRVLRTAEVHPGPRTNDLPDLIIEWHETPARGSSAVGRGTGSTWRGHSDRTGVIEHRYGGGRTGAHRIRGLLFVHGAGVPAGHVDRLISTLDLPPTFARWLECAPPTPFGSAVPELFPDE